MLNTELMRKVADAILAKPEYFHMKQWVVNSDCGTVACIAGHVLIESGEYKVKNRTTDSSGRFGRFLDYWVKQEGEIQDEIELFYTPDIAKKLLGGSIMIKIPEDCSSGMVEDNRHGDIVDIFYAEWLDAEGAAKELYKIANEAEVE